jgi:predicted RecB family endonuclease
VSAAPVFATLQIYLVIVSAPLNPQQGKSPQGSPPAVEAVEALLRASGYNVLERLQTRDAGLDRLIAVFDIVAYGEGNGLAIQLKTGGPDAPEVTWPEASALPSATWAVYKAAEQFGVNVNSIRPMMVLAGRRADASLKLFAEKEAIHIVEMQDAKVIDDIVNKNFSDEQLRGMAQTILGLRPLKIAPPNAARQEIA